MHSNTHDITLGLHSLLKSISSEQLFVTYLYATNTQCHYVNYVENCFNNVMQTKSLISLQSLGEELGPG